MNVTINPQEIQEELRTSWLGHQIYYYPKVLSTNDLLKEMAREGEPAGALVLADYQSQGKGRHGRQWQAPAGSSLLFSLLFRPAWPVEQANWLTMMAGMAVVNAIAAEIGLVTALKWPNDIVVEKKGQIRKTGGILLESVTNQRQIIQVILGIGLNANISAGELPKTSVPATSLSIELGRNVPRQKLLIRLLQELELLYSLAEQGQSPQPAWNKLLINIGQPVRVIKSGRREAMDGTAVGTDSWGQLLVRDQEGKIQSISAGDVTLRG